MMNPCVSFNPGMFPILAVWEDPNPSWDFFLVASGPKKETPRRHVVKTCLDQ